MYNKRTVELLDGYCTVYNKRTVEPLDRYGISYTFNLNSNPIAMR